MENQEAEHTETNRFLKNAIAELKQKLQPSAHYVLLTWSVIYVCLIGVGVYGMWNCPLEPYIPGFLVITGIMGIVTKLIHFTKDTIFPKVDTTIVVLISGLYINEVLLLILGTYWLLRYYELNYDQNKSQNYCDKVVYLIALIYIITTCIVAVMAVLGFCAYLVYTRYVQLTTDTEESGDNLPQIKIKTRQSTTDAEELHTETQL